MAQPFRTPVVCRTLMALTIAAAMTGCASWSPVFGSRADWQTRIKSGERVADSGRAGSELSSRAKADYDLAKFWMVQGRNDLALKVLDRLISSDTSHAEALNARASLLASAGDWAAAERDLTQAIQFAPERAHLYFNLGLLLASRGATDRVRSALERATELDPDHQRARELLATLTPAPSAHRVAESDVSDQPRNTGSPISPMAASSPEQASPPLPAQDPAARSSQHDALVRVPENAFETPILQAQAAQAIPAVVADIRPVAVEPEPATRVIRVTGAQLDMAPLRGGTAAIIAIAPSANEPARIDVANGNGINGMAKAMRGQLRAVGVQVATISNWSNFHQPVTRVLYREGHELAARELAQRLPVQAELVAVARLPRADRDVMVVLGLDMRGYRPTATGWESMANLADHPGA